MEGVFRWRPNAIHVARNAEDGQKYEGPTMSGFGFGASEKRGWLSNYSIYPVLAGLLPFLVIATNLGSQTGLSKGQLRLHA